MLHPPEIKDRARELIADGLTNREIADKLGIGRETVRSWRREKAGARTVPAYAFSPPSRPCVETDAAGHVVNQKGRW